MYRTQKKNKKVKWSPSFHSQNQSVLDIRMGKKSAINLKWQNSGSQIKQELLILFPEEIIEWGNKSLNY